MSPELVATGLGRAPQFVEVAFAQIDQSIARGDAEIGLSGIEDTPARRAAYAVTLPYYQFREVLSVRSADAGRFRRFADLRGRRVGTLSGTIAYEILLAAERDHGIVAVSYEDDVHPYSDLLIGRLDAVLAGQCPRRHGVPGRRPDLSPTRSRWRSRITWACWRQATTRFAIRSTRSCKQAMKDGRLESIFRKWKVWNDDQPPLFASVLAGEPIPPIVGLRDRQHRDAAQMGSDAPVSAVTPSRRRCHLDHVVRRHGVRRRNRHGHCDRPPLRRQPDQGGAHRIR